jgi:hypothetical protein
MRIFIFTGPSLSPREARGHWKEPTYLPPAAQGDVYLKTLRKPWGIGIIDGYFERLPAVWHKEILWALSHGIRVYGSASMGALRAAELAPFGMIGVGSIFEHYLRGNLEDDDEVTVVHAPQVQNYRPSSEAMVNVRCTLDNAVRERIVSQSTADRLTRAAKSLFYPLRTFEKILDEGHCMRLPASELTALWAWLPDGRIDQKRLDAIAMLNRMQEDLSLGRARIAPGFSVENTSYWHRARRDARASIHRSGS